MRLPKWAQWQADNPPTGIDPGVNRRFWRVIGWEVRFWLAFLAFMVLLAIVLLIVLIVEAV